MDGVSSSSSVSDSASGMSVSEGQRLQVCGKYQRGECTLLSCPLAHPGVRDNADIFHCRCVRRLACRLHAERVQKGD
jgi:hypothetical protein